MFGLAKREQRCKAEQEIASIAMSLLARISLKELGHAPEVRAFKGETA